MKTLVALSVSILVGVCCAEGQETQQVAQNAQQTPSSGASSSSSSAPRPKGERRISGGATLTVLGIGLIPNATNTVNNTSEISTQYQTKGATDRFGYGLTVQGRITTHFYVDVSGLLRHIGYQETTTVSTTVTEVLNGATFPQTTTTSMHEDTRARLIDVPVLVRYYGLGKPPRGPRWFLEAGATWRSIDGIRTSTDSTDASGNLTCCTFNAATPKNHSVIGLTAGAGIQFTDEFGIHVVPEVRYTHWESPIFDNVTTRSKSTQIEGDISITF